MPEPTARQSHIDRALTNVSIAYKNAAYVWPEVFPRVQVQKISDKYFTFTKGYWFRLDTGPRAPGARASRGGYALTNTLYTCLEQAIAHQIPDELIDNSDDPLTPLVRGTEFVTAQIYSAIENDVLDLVFSTGWASSATPGTLWSNDASDPLGDIETGMNSVATSIGREPNVGVIGRGLWRYLKNHPDVIDRIKYGSSSADPAKASAEAIAATVGLERILVAGAVEDTSTEPNTATMAYLGGNHMALIYVPTGPALDVPSAGYTFMFRNVEISRFREEQERADVVEARASWDAKITASDAGYLIKSAA